MNRVDAVSWTTGLLRRVFETGLHEPSSSGPRATPGMSHDDENPGWVPDPSAVRDAWKELRQHPALMWVPPMWRSHVDSDAAVEVMRRHAVSAIERNLVIEVETQDDGSLLVRLATGPLRDRIVDGGIDPVAPAGGVDAKLDVFGSSFEDAVVKLYEAVESHYGSGERADARRAGGSVTPLQSRA